MNWGLWNLVPRVRSMTIEGGYIVCWSNENRLRVSSIVIDDGDDGWPLKPATDEDWYVPIVATGLQIHSKTTWATNAKPWTPEIGAAWSETMRLQREFRNLRRHDRDVHHTTAKEG